MNALRRARHVATVLALFLLDGTDQRRLVAYSLRTGDVYEVPGRATNLLRLHT